MSAHDTFAPLLSRSEIWAVPEDSESLRPFERDLMRSVQLAKAVADEWAHCQCEGDSAARERVHAALHAFLVDALANYQSGLNGEQMNSIYANTARCSDFDYLRTLARGAIPIALIRALLRRDGVNFCCHEIPLWEKFCDVYGRYVLP